MTVTLCRHCEENAAAPDRRGLCQKCHASPAIRAKYESTSKYGRRLPDTEAELDAVVAEQMPTLTRLNADDLPPGQRRVFEAICQHWIEHATGPSYREIGKACGIGSINGVAVHLAALRRKGFIELAGDSEQESRRLHPTGFAEYIREACQRARRELFGE